MRSLGPFAIESFWMTGRKKMIKLSLYERWGLLSPQDAREIADAITAKRTLKIRQVSVALKFNNVEVKIGSASEIPILPLQLAGALRDEADGIEP